MDISKCKNCDKNSNQCDIKVVRQMHIIGNLHGIADGHCITVHYVKCSKYNSS